MIKPGRYYHHYKGKDYVVVSTATHTETKEKMVVYHEVGKPEIVWVRPADMWDDIIMVDGHAFPRFALVEETSTIQTFEQRFRDKIHDLDPDVAKLVNEHFWDLVGV